MEYIQRERKGAVTIDRTLIRTHSHHVDLLSRKNGADSIRALRKRTKKTTSYTIFFMLVDNKKQRIFLLCIFEYNISKRAGGCSDVK